MKEDRPREGGPQSTGHDADTIVIDDQGRNPYRLQHWCPSSGGYCSEFYLYRCIRCGRSIGGAA
jgi:hypothetical protein